MVALEMEGAPPHLDNLKLCSPNDYIRIGANPDLDLYVEGDISFDGAISLKLRTDCKVNWPGFAFLVIPIALNIKVKQLSGRIKLLYSENT
jgi:hypothetical protein